MEQWEPCGLKWLGERAYGGGGGADFLVGEETPQGHYVNKAGKFLYLAEKQLHKV